MGRPPPAMEWDTYWVCSNRTKTSLDLFAVIDHPLAGPKEIFLKLLDFPYRCDCLVGRSGRAVLISGCANTQRGGKHEEGSDSKDDVGHITAGVLALECSDTWGCASGGARFCREPLSPHRIRDSRSVLSVRRAVSESAGGT